jgi:hypothetical protein
MLYTLPSLMDDLTIKASYSPSGAEKPDSAKAYSATYTGVEGLSVSYATGESNTKGSEADTTTLKGSYAIGSITVSASATEHDLSSGNDDEVDSYNIAYTVSDDLSISYGTETHSTAGSTTDEEVDAITVSYTSGGMTISAASIEATGVGHVAGSTAALSLGFGCNTRNLSNRSSPRKSGCDLLHRSPIWRQYKGQRYGHGSSPPHQPLLQRWQIAPWIGH